MSDSTAVSPDHQVDLRRYLPGHLWERWQAGDAEGALSHLQSVFRAVVGYLPRHVVQAKLVNPAAPAVSGIFSRATLMFADISGFTAMSERLSQLGREGAEIITSIVNDYFATMLDVIARYDGDLYKFGGDALLVSFDGVDAALRACAAALAMQEAMVRFAEIETDQGTFSLRMKVGLGTGTLFLAGLGSPARLEFAVMGPALGRMASAESKAQAGEVLCDRETRTDAGSTIVTAERAPDLFVVERLKETAPPISAGMAHPELPSDPVSVERLVERLDALTPYIPPRVAERIVASPGRRIFEGEHRLVTVLFANFYGIDDVVAALAPDHAPELTAIINRHFTAVQRIIQKYGGIVNKVDTYAVGYRVMAVYGAPMAHEDDPARAVRAALEIQQEVAVFNQGRGVPTSAGRMLLKQRIGVNTGYVFAGNVGSALRREYSVMGDEVNLAARLMGVAKDGELLISQSTARHVEGMFEWQVREPVPVKGKRRPVSNYRVLQGTSERHARVGAPGAFIGRQSELATARALVDAALDGRGSVLDVFGDAGVGKTRLVAQIRERAVGRGMETLQGEAIAIGLGIPYRPWLTVLRALFGFHETDDPTNRRQKLLSGLGVANLGDWAPVVGRVLGVDIPDTPLTAALDAQLRQQRFYDVVLQVIQGRARQAPLLLVLDDMQWADAVSLDLATYVARNLSDSPLLFIIAHRPDLETSPWRDEDLCHTLHLREMPEQDTIDLARAVLTDGDLSPALRRLILDRAQGNPLFVEEVVRELRESNIIRLADAADAPVPPAQSAESRQVSRPIWVLNKAAADVEVPTTLTGLIMSRMDRLETTNRRLLQVAAVIGVDFQRPTLARVYPYDDLNGSLPDRLDELVRLDLATFAPPDTFSFKHTLAQEVAYASLPFSLRRALHVRAGEEIENHHTGDLAEHYEVLARHFDQGRLYDKAFVYTFRAADKARDEFANDAALSYYRRALEIVARLETTDAEIATLDVLEAMGDIYLLTGLYDEAAQAFQNAVSHPSCSARRSGVLLGKLAQTCERQGQYDEALQYLSAGRWVLSGDESDRLSLEMARLYNLSAWVQVRRAEPEQAIQDCELGLGLLENLERSEEVLRAEADLYNALGSVYADVQDDYSQAAQVYRRSAELREQIGDLPSLPSSYNNLAKTAWGQGDLEGARADLERSLEISHQIGHNYAIAFAYSNLGVVAYSAGDVQQALDYYLTAVPLRQRMGDNFGLAQTFTNIGEAYVALKQFDQARPYLERAADLYRTLQSESELPDVYCLLAQVDLTLGDVTSALRYAAQALRLAEAVGNLLWQGVAHRYLAQGHTQAGDQNRALEELEASVASLEHAGNPKELAQSYYELALLLTDRGRSPGEIRPHLEQAIDLFASGGAEEQAAQARAVLGRLGA